jgi:hypothetical protein
MPAYLQFVPFVKKHQRRLRRGGDAIKKLTERDVGRNGLVDSVHERYSHFQYFNEY